MFARYINFILVEIFYENISQAFCRYKGCILVVLGVRHNFLKVGIRVLADSDRHGIRNFGFSNKSRMKFYFELELLTLPPFANQL